MTEVKYKMGEKVKFKVKGVEKVGEVYIIDPRGTWGQKTTEPSYDILVEEENMLYKHWVQSLVSKYDN